MKKPVLKLMGLLCLSRGINGISRLVKCASRDLKELNPEFDSYRSTQ